MIIVFFANDFFIKRSYSLSIDLLLLNNQGEIIMATTTKQTTSNLKDTNSKSPWTDKTSDTLHETVDKVATKASTAEENIRNAASKSADTVSVKKDELQKQLNSSVGRARKAAAENPLATAGIAFAAGLVVSALLSRRS